MTDPTREAFDSDVDLMRDVYMLPSQRGAYERILQAALSARAQGEELNDWLDLLELPEGYEVEEFLPGVYHYINWLDGVKKVGGDCWNHPALAAISAWQNTTPAARAVDVDEAMVERLRDHLVELRCYYVEARDGVRGYSAREAQYTRLIEEVDADLAALTQTEANSHD